MKFNALLLVGMGLVTNYSLSLSAAAPKAKPLVAELKKLQGVWDLLETESAGQKRKPIPAVQWVFKGDEFLIATRGKLVPQGMISLDTSKKPKTIDVMLQGKPVSLGIYEQKGHTLKVCWSGTVRPSDFAASGASVISVLERAKSLHSKSGGRAAISGFHRGHRPNAPSKLTPPSDEATRPGAQTGEGTQEPDLASRER